MPDSTVVKHAHHPRYARQRILRELGEAGQEKLAAARVLIVGAGGLGSPAAAYLAAAGVGTIGLVDNDLVDESNLHRQLLYSARDIGTDKLRAAQVRLDMVNPLVRVVLHRTLLTVDNAAALVAEYDIVLDGTDNFPARYAINDACVRRGIPFVYGSIARFEGQVSVFAAPDGPCYRCLFPEAPAAGTVPNCAEDGVIGVLPGIVGLHQATEVIKWITKLGRMLVGRLLMLDLLDHSTTEVQLQRNPACSVCGTSNSTKAHNSVTAGARASIPEGASAQSASPPRPTSSPASTMQQTASEIEVATLAQRLAAGDRIVLLDVREQWEYDLGHLPNAQLVPLSTLVSARASLDGAAEYVVYCHHGSRSAMAANWLASQGFERVSNMTGGIDAWSDVVDPSVPRY